jgi:hypothetical protein
MVNVYYVLSRCLHACSNLILPTTVEKSTIVIFLICPFTDEETKAKEDEEIY